MYPLINGNEFSFASVLIDLGGMKFSGISALNWSQELTPEDVYGNGAVAVSQTLGQYKASADFEQNFSEYQLLINKLGNAYMTKRFNVGCQYRETPGAGLVRVEIIGARIAKEEVSNASGAAGTKVKVTLSFIRPIRMNGKTAIHDALSKGLKVSSALQGLISGI
jgi:hypothetical protein